MILFLFLLTYRLSRNITSFQTILKIGDFGFESNSTFYIAFTKVGSHNLVFCFFSEEEFSKYPLSQIPISQVCHTNSDFPRLRYHISSANIPFYINGTISNPGVYTQIIANCQNSDFLPTQMKLSFTEVFKNPTSTLDSRWKGIKKLKTLIIIVYSIAFLLWTINLIRKYSNISKLQILLTFTFISYLFLIIVRILELNQLESFDNDSYLTISRKIIAFIQKFLLYISVLFIVKGWCTTSNRVSSETYYYIFVILVFDAMLFIIDLGYFSNINITFLVISAFCACLLLHKIIISLNEVRQYLFSKMLSIINTTDYKIAEINKMRSKFVTLEISILLSSFIYILVLISTQFIKIPFYLTESVNDFLLIVFLIILMILFKDNRFGLNNNGYDTVVDAFALTELSPLANMEPTNEVIEDDTIIAASE